MDLNPAEFEAHYGREGLNPTKVNTSYPFFAKSQKIVRNTQKISKNVQGVSLAPSFKPLLQHIVQNKKFLLLSEMVGFNSKKYLSI